MDAKNLTITLLVCGLLFFWYQKTVEKVKLQNHGQQAKAIITEVQPHEGFSYIRFKYTVAGKEYLKSLRKYDRQKYREGDSFTFFYLPESPDNPFLNVDKGTLDRDIYYILVLGVIALLYRTVKLMVMVMATRPNE